MKYLKNEAAFEEARRAVSRIELGFKAWSNLSLQSRIDRVRRLRKAVSANAQRIAEAIAEECGRPVVESLSQEVLSVLEMAKYCEKMYPKWLAPQKLPYRRPGFFRKKNALYYEPLGPVAVFSPQNFPFSLGMMTLIYTLLPGNTVVLKLSEKSTRVPAVIEEVLRDSGLIDRGAVSLLSGGAEAGKWLIENPSIKKIFFFGQRSSGEKVAQHCVKHMKPFVLEMGGGSTAIVCAQADLEQAATGLAWSSFYAHGKSCVATERIFVDERIAEKFMVSFKEKVSKFHKGTAIHMKRKTIDPAEISRLNELIEDAKTKGAHIFQAGMSHSQENNGLFDFTIISNASNSMRVYHEEIFGPIVVVFTISNLEEAIAKIGQGFHCLGASIWSRNNKQALYLAKKISTGMIWINDSSFGLPHLPWGGIGKTGWGKLFSEFAIQEVTNQKWISAHPGKFARPRLWWNPYASVKEKILVKIAENFL